MSSTHPNSRTILGASIEVTPKQAIESVDLPGLFPAGTRVYITDLGTDSDRLLAEAAERLASLAYVPVAHIAARRCPTREALETRLKLLSEVGVSDMLVIGGGVEKPAGEFSSSMDLLGTGLFEKYGMREIGVAGYPEGSPDFASEVAMQALRWKVEYGTQTGTKVRIVSQFCFDPDAVLSWASGLRLQDIDLPVHVGIAGPAKLTTLIKYASICGVGNSLEFLRKHAHSLLALTANQSPESVVSPIEEAAAADEHSKIHQIHVFTFGGVKSAAKWLTNRGSWSGSDRKATSERVAANVG